MHPMLFDERWTKMSKIFLRKLLECTSSSSFLRKIFDIFVHLSSNRIGCISPWIVDRPCNLRENGDGSEVPVWWLGRELDLFSACRYLGIPGGGPVCCWEGFRVWLY